MRTPLAAPMILLAPLKQALAANPHHLTGLFTLLGAIVLSVVAGCVLALNRVTE